MTNSKFKRMSSATAVFLAFATSQVCLSSSLAGPGGTAGAPPQQSTAILKTSGNKPISVNGVSAASGATVLTGAAVETPDKVEATVDIPGRFSLEIEPNAKLTMVFDANAIKVTLIRGCVELETEKGTSGEIVNEEGRSLGRTDPTKGGEIDTCERRVVPFAIFGAAAADAGIAAAILVNRGRNPSPGAP